MRSFIKKIGVLVLILIIGLIIIYNRQIRKLITSKNTYFLVYESENFRNKDSIYWYKHKKLFPNDFNPQKISSFNPEEILKLDSKQLIKYDSLLNLNQNYPKKYINHNTYKTEYGIYISKNEIIQFDYDKNDIVFISPDKIENFKPIVEPDSLLNILGIGEYNKSKENFNSYDLTNNQFFIIEKNKNKALYVKAKPIYILTD